MKIANADKLIHHFKTVVDVHLFTPAEIITIIDTFSAEVTEGRKYVFSYDYDGTPIVTDLDAKQSLNNLLKISSEENQQMEWGRWAVTEVQCPECLGWFSTDCYSKEEMKKCPGCGAHLIGGTRP